MQETLQLQSFAIKLVLHAETPGNLLRPGDRQVLILEQERKSGNIYGGTFSSRNPFLFSLSDRYCCSPFSQNGKLGLREIQWNCPDLYLGSAPETRWWQIHVRLLGAYLPLGSGWTAVKNVSSSNPASSLTLARCRSVGKVLDLMIATFLEEFHGDSLRLSTWRALDHKEFFCYWKSVLPAAWPCGCLAATARWELCFPPVMISVKPCFLWSLDLCPQLHSGLELS